MRIRSTFIGFSISATLYNFLLEAISELADENDSDLRSLSLKRDPDQRVSLFHAYGLWRRLMHKYPDSDIGIWFAKRLTPQKANLIGHMFLETRNLRESVTLMQRYLSIFADNIGFSFEESGDEVVFSVDISPSYILNYSVTECYLCICYFWALRYMEKEKLGVKMVSLTYPEPPHVHKYKEIEPGAKFKFNQKLNAVVLDRSLFYQENENHSDYLKQMLATHASGLLIQYAAETTYTPKVVKRIQEMMPEEPPTLESIAETLHLSPRTLRRRLHSENVSFRELLDAVRKEMAHSLVSDKHLLMEEIAYLLGYHEYASFFKAFKKWFGLSPSDFRAKQKYHS